jgi:hypothetical protein
MQVALGPGSGGGANAAQVRNIALCSQLQEVHRSLVTLLPRLPAPAAAALSTPLEALQATAIDTGGQRACYRGSGRGGSGSPLQRRGSSSLMWQWLLWQWQ